MTRFGQRLKDHKKAIHPVIAVIILIAVTLVLALVVGAYTFGLFGSNVRTITLTTASLYVSGSFQFALKNPGTNTTISSVILTSGNGNQTSLSTSSIQVGNTTTNMIAGGQVSSITLPVSASFLVSDQTYSYVITFQNGQSITGSQIAQ